MSNLDSATHHKEGDTPQGLTVYEIPASAVIRIEEKVSKRSHLEAALGVAQTRNNTLKRLQSLLEEKRSTATIPPIITLREPLGQEDELIEKFEKFHRKFPLEKEETVTRDQLLNRYRHLRREREVILLSYNGNTRLEAHQNAERNIRAYIITSEAEFRLIPPEEDRFLETSFEEFSEYEQCFFTLLRDYLLRLIKNEAVHNYPKFTRRIS